MNPRMHGAFPCAFGAGERVVDQRDPRHEGRVRAVFTTTTVRIDWDNGWQSEVDAKHLTLVADCPARAAERDIERTLQKRGG